MARKIKVDRIHVSKEMECFIEAAKVDASNKWNDRLDVVRSITAQTTGARKYAYECDKSSAGKLSFILEMDIALELARGVIYDNFDHFQKYPHRRKQEGVNAE